MNRQSTRCPICQRPARKDYHPFCSKRCSEVDLGRWLGGDYSIPGPPADIPDPDEEPDEKD